MLSEGSPPKTEKWSFSVRISDQDSRFAKCHFTPSPPHPPSPENEKWSFFHSELQIRTIWVAGVSLAASWL